MNYKKFLLGSMVLVSLSGCITFPTEESRKVRVFWDETQRVAQCEHKGIVYGSEGHFYDYWLHSDRDMIWGAVNQMSIRAVAMGADTLYLYRPFGFLSSVTLMANAYKCGTQDTTRSTLK